METSHPWTCLTCNLAFSDSNVHRQHYASELHRYNAKRKMAGLEAVSKETFEEKVVGKEKQKEGEEAEKEEKWECKACSKKFSSHNAHQDHLKSKKHRDTIFKSFSAAKMNPSTKPTVSPTPRPGPESSSTPVTLPSNLPKDIESLTRLRLSTHPPLPPLTCLFCHPNHLFPSTSSLLEHMQKSHGFFVPDSEYLVDLEGFLKRLAEEVGTWNVCLKCGKGFAGDVEVSDGKTTSGGRNGTEAVRKHMRDKEHCKIPWESEEDRMAYVDFFDYRSSYPDYKKDEEWEDANDDGEEDGEEDAENEAETDEDDEDLQSSPSEITYGDTPFELVLPSGARIGHRSLRTVYSQNLVPYATSSNLSSRIARKYVEANLSNNALVPVRGLGGNFGKGGEVVKARNRGEAREAGKDIREFREMKKRTEFEMTRGLKANAQKHVSMRFFVRKMTGLLIFVGM